MGRFVEASRYHEEAIRLAESNDRAFTIGFAHYTEGMLHVAKGEWANAVPIFEHAIGRFRSGNVPLLLPLVVSLSARVLAELGKTSEALNRLREGEQLIERRRTTAIGAVLASLGHACLRLGRLDESQRLGGRAVELSPRQAGVKAQALHLLGNIATHPDRFDSESGEGYYRRALALAEPHGMLPLVAHCHLGLGKLYACMGKRDVAREHLRTATTMYREMDIRFYLEQAEAELRAALGP
jgi:tetratricopeptide (TPR) repeat protein